MKIECDKCGAKYSIADDKVRGKTFKIRCKKCSNVIIVRDKAGGAEDGGDAPADEPGWHLAIGGETVGPISEAEVRERFAAGEIDKDTSVWQEGFEDWLPLGDVGAFSDLAAAPGRSAAPDPFAGGSDDDYSAPAPAATPSSSSYDRQPEPARQPAAAAPAASTSGPKASASPAASGENPRVSSLTGARNENSVLFSLDSLSSIAMGSKQGGGGPAPSGPSFSLGSGGGGGGGGARRPRRRATAKVRASSTSVP
ncbi:GYF domain-containing protein [Nannocystis pusilla]|uniref:GYF domain-containing protein n=1 Tax=Nannocystis pusilla TaxID=889268 RepID=UPI003B7997D9